MFLHTSRLQFESKPGKPDPVYALKLQELIGGAYGEMTVYDGAMGEPSGPALGTETGLAGKIKDAIS